ncbi:reverse transcriptase [Colletotrichum abscissum]
MATLLRDPNIDNYDIIAIQEPWRNPYSATTHHPAKDRFHLCYPSSEENGSARVCFFINKKLDHSRWQFGEVSRYLCTLIIATDGTELLDLIGDINLTSQLRAGTITYEDGDHRITINPCIVTIGLVDRIIRCEADHNINHDSDHLLIATSLHLAVTELQREEKRKWKAIDKETFIETLRGSLPEIQRPRTKAALDKYVEKTIDALSTATKVMVPTSTLSPKSRRGWDEQRAGRHIERHAIGKAASSRKLSNKHIAKQWKQRPNHPGRRGRSPNGPGTDGASPTVTPEIKKPNTSQVVTTPEEKAALFKETFFPPPQEANLEDIDNTSYSNQIGLPPVSESEVEDAIQEAAPLKALGPDGITNLALQVARPWIMPYLARIFNQSLRLGYCLQHFRKSTTVVLKKLGKDNYTVPKAYRPIALLNTVGKIMDANIVRRLSYFADTHGLLPDSQMGGRRCRLTEHALHQIVDKIDEARGSGKGIVASLLLLDVSGAFDNVRHRRLLHNLRKRRIDEATVHYIANFLGCRET